MFNVRDFVEKEVVPFGNGSMVVTPKKWLGEKVVVVLQETEFDVAAEILDLLKPHLSNVQGVFLYGSFARNEQTENSDIDVLVIADKKFDLPETDRFDVTVSTKDSFIRELGRDSTLFLRQIVSEAKPILNGLLLSELKGIEVNPDMKAYFEDTLGAFKKTQELLNESRGKEFLESNTAIYSLILRLKGLFSIQCFKKNARFSNKKFSGMLKGHGFSGKTINELLEAYRDERKEKKPKIKVSVRTAEKLFETAKAEFVKAEGPAK